MRVFLDLMWFFKQEKKPYMIGISILAFVALLQLIPPKIVGYIVDEIKDNKFTPLLLTKWIIVMILVAVSMYVLRYYWRIMIFGSSYKLARVLRNRLFHHFTKMSPSFYQNNRVGDLMAHATNDLQAIQVTAGSGVLTLVDSMMTGGSVIIAMACTISWKLTLIALIPMPIMAVLTSFYGSILHKRFHKAQEAFSDLNDKTQESINGIKVIKTFGQENEDILSFIKQSDDVVKKNIAVSRIDALFDPTISIIIALSFFLSIIFGSKLVINHELTIGQLISFTTYIGLLTWPMLAFGSIFNIMERGRASNERVKKLLSEHVEIKDKPNAINNIPTGAIEYQIDSFRYPNENKVILEHIHFTLNQGETLGIVGKTGAGKTTMLKLLIREFEGYDGEIYFGERSIQDYQMDHLRSAIGYVPQDHFLFSTTVGENIAFANPMIRKEKIEEAARLAQIHHDIEEFTDGYETLVGEKGVSLSGGQKQRISIARALIMDPEVLILDDSLSAVDAKTEESILKALKDERFGKTTIITAHRLSAIKHANLIIVLDDGKIIESGNHDQLMRGNGWYKAMYDRQQLEELVEHGG